MVQYHLRCFASIAEVRRRLKSPLALCVLILTVGCTQQPNSREIPTPARSLDAPKLAAGICRPGASANLPIPLKPQETLMWCWAASGEMVMAYLGKPVRQCIQANNLFSLKGVDCCAQPVANGCVNGGWPEFQKYGVSYQKTSNLPLSWDQLTDQLYCQKKPIAFSWGWIDDIGQQNGGHMMVAVGYVPINGTDFVTVNDPWPPGQGGDLAQTTYANYVSGPDHVHWDDFYDFK